MHELLVSTEIVNSFENEKNPKKLMLSSVLNRAKKGAIRSMRFNRLFVFDRDLSSMKNFIAYRD